jgi:hypothetical protein
MSKNGYCSTIYNSRYKISGAKKSMYWNSGAIGFKARGMVSKGINLLSTISACSNGKWCSSAFTFQA